MHSNTVAAAVPLSIKLYDFMYARSRRNFKTLIKKESPVFKTPLVRYCPQSWKNTGEKNKTETTKRTESLKLTKR